jgi:competence ComEA-like helix-hairpin-helix protein
VNDTWKEWFVFTRKERTGVLVLVTLILSVTCLPWFLPPHFPKYDGAMTKKLQAGLLILQTSLDSIAAKRPDDDRYLSHHDAPASKKAITYFEFDPNTLSAEGWRKLGLRERSIQTIQKYRAHGGKFRRPEDMKKIYGLHADEAEKLIPYVRIQAAKPLFEKKEYTKKVKSALRIVDINLADTSAFIDLPGIGSKLARRIIAFRDKLGGFHSVDQLKETYGLPDSTFQKIRPLLQCSESTIKRININTADFQTLMRHPYIGRNLANVIVHYREQHGPYRSLEDLEKIVLLTPEILEKIHRYLVVE